MAPLIPTSTSKWILTITIYSFLLVLPSSSTDPSPLQDFCVADLSSSTLINGFPCKPPAHVTSDDFFHTAFNEVPTEFNSYNINVTRVDVTIFPGLNTLGLSMNRVVLNPGGINPPHVHPRASELSLVLDGTIFVGWVTTANVFYWKVLTQGDLFVIPPGLVHFQLNVGEDKARFFASFNSQNPGLQAMPAALFNSTPIIPDQVLSKAFKVDRVIIELIKSGFATLRSSSY